MSSSQEVPGGGCHTLQSNQLRLPRLCEFQRVGQPHSELRRENQEQGPRPTQAKGRLEWATVLSCPAFGGLTHNQCGFSAGGRLSGLGAAWRGAWRCSICFC